MQLARNSPVCGSQRCAPQAAVSATGLSSCVRRWAAKEALGLSLATSRVVPQHTSTSGSRGAFERVVVHGRGSTSEPWWEKNTAANMKSVNSVQELVDALADAGDRLVIVDYYAQWCSACRALYPKLCKLMEENPDVLLLKVDLDANKQMCKTLNVKVLPYFQFYRGGEGRVDAFSCSVSKLQRMKDALSNYTSPFCSLEPTPELPEFPDVHPHVIDGKSLEPEELDEARSLVDSVTTIINEQSQTSPFASSSKGPAAFDESMAAVV